MPLDTRKPLSEGYIPGDKLVSWMSKETKLALAILQRRQRRGIILQVVLNSMWNRTHFLRLWNSTTTKYRCTANSHSASEQYQATPNNILEQSTSKLDGNPDLSSINNALVGDLRDSNESNCEQLDIDLGAIMNITVLAAFPYVSIYQLADNEPVAPYVVNGQPFDKGYYLQMCLRHPNNNPALKDVVNSFVVAVLLYNLQGSRTLWEKISQEMSSLKGINNRSATTQKGITPGCNRSLP
ncbi:hypothetical protein Tco_1092587 [Tanacetum coccineum]|uniref:Uncharacterized protein n=1 Tax=Tanacetum coccineum TaxID=301880 RepID=A0ABQ5IBK6_9ASTR